MAGGSADGIAGRFDDDLKVQVRAVRRLISQLDAMVQARPSGVEAGDPATGSPVGRARTITAQRRRRDRVFNRSAGASPFGDPAWDMLLDLYILEAAGRRISATGLCRAASVPVRSGLRYIAIMTSCQWVERRPDGVDNPEAWVSLTPKGRRLMTAALS